PSSTSRRTASSLNACTSLTRITPNASTASTSPFAATSRSGRPTRPLSASPSRRRDPSLSLSTRAYGASRCTTRASTTTRNALKS
ncbi:cathepsin L-like protein, partial [Aphelenchoides avenae]